MGSGIDSFKLSGSLLEIQKRLDDLRTKCISNPCNAEEILSNALKQLQVTFEELSAAGEELVHQNDKIILAQEASREIEECYRAFIALSSEGIWRLESEQPMPISMPEDDQIEFILAHAYFAECNDACARMYGLTNAEELIGIRMTDLLPRSDPQNIEVIRAFIRSGYRLVDKETYEIDKEGNSHCITNSVTGIVENNCLVRVWGVQRDITERKRAEEAIQNAKDELEQKVQERTEDLENANKALRKSEELARQRLMEIEDLYCSAPVGLCVLDTEMRFVRINERLAEINGIHAADHIGRTFQELLPDIADAAEEIFRKVMESGKPALGIEVCGKTPAQPGVERFCQESWLPLKDSQGNVVGINIVAEEITERKKAEKELLLAKEAAEESAKAKAFFMANMSHELRTPMNSVIGFTSLLLDEKLTPEQTDFVEGIRNGGEALMTVINDILDFSRMEREKTELELQPFDLRTLTEEAVDLVAAQAAEKDLELIYAFGQATPEAIIGDPGKLRQVLGNLISNAVKFTTEGEVEVYVSSDLKQNEIHFAVRDTGIGIPLTDMGKLFQPFSQLDMSYSRGFEGTGLGLAISKKLIELMEGKIWVESEPGVGSTFHAIIPAKAAPNEHKPFLSEKFKGKRALIAAENQTLRRILGHQLHAWGVMSVMAETPQEAVRLLQRDRAFDAVIIDTSKDDTVALILMDENRKYWTDLPLIALTSLGRKVTPDLFRAVLTKPLKPAQLFYSLRDVLEKNETSEQVENPEMEKSYGPLRILLAEDNLSNQKVTLQMLNKLGYRADAVANGREVLEALERQPYDIVFMDVKMPVMNGIEAARAIRERWPENGPKIIAITAYVLHGDKEKCLDAGMEGYIPKPVQKEDLAEVLKRYSLIK